MSLPIQLPSRYAPRTEPFTLLPCATFALYGSRIVGRRKILKCTAAMSRQTAKGLSQLPEVRSLISYGGAQLTRTSTDGFVRIWSTEAIYKAADPNFTKPRQLASMSYHSGTIHSVRFAGNGQYLASGADDKVVCIYKYDPNPPSQSDVFGMLKYIVLRCW